MDFTRDDVNALFSLVPLVLWQIYSPTKGKTKQYESERKNIAGAPKGYLFGIVWSVIYSLIIASGFIYFRENESSKYYISAAVIFLVNILLNKFWSVAFWRDDGKSVALGIIIILIVTSAAFMMLLALDHSWISFGLYTPYVLWLGYATYLNWAWMLRGTPEKIQRQIKTARPQWKSSPSSAVIVTTTVQQQQQQHRIPRFTTK